MQAVTTAATRTTQKQIVKNTPNAHMKNTFKTILMKIKKSTTLGIILLTETDKQNLRSMAS